MFRQEGGRLSHSVIHLLVVDVSCVMFWDQASQVSPKQNTRTINHKQMNNGVGYSLLPSLKDLMLPVRLELVFLVLLAMAPPLVRELLLSTV